MNLFLYARRLLRFEITWFDNVNPGRTPEGAAQLLSIRERHATAKQHMARVEQADRPVLENFETVSCECLQPCASREGVKLADAFGCRAVPKRKEPRGDRPKSLLERAPAALIDGWPNHVSRNARRRQRRVHNPADEGPEAPRRGRHHVNSEAPWAKNSAEFAHNCRDILNMLENV